MKPVFIHTVLSLCNISVFLRGQSSCAPVLVLPVSVALRSAPLTHPHPPNRILHTLTIILVEKKITLLHSQTQTRKALGAHVKTKGSSPSLPLQYQDSNLQYKVLQSQDKINRQRFTFTFMPSCVWECLSLLHMLERPLGRIVDC